MEQPLLCRSSVDSPTRKPSYYGMVIGALLLGALLGAVASNVCLGLMPDSRLSHEGPAVRGNRTLFRVLDRDVWVYYPGKARTIVGDNPLPAVVVLHGSEDFPLAIADASGFEEVSESAKETFLAVYPEMSTPGGEEWGYGNDLGFFAAVVDMLDREFRLRREEVYVCGHSAGGTMALYLQNELPGVFRGAASVEAGVDHPWMWNKSRFGRPTMLVWNHNDPVLKAYHLKMGDTIDMLRRHDSTGSGPSFSTDVPVINRSSVLHARKISWGAVGPTPPTVAISWESNYSTHHWPNLRNVPGSFDAAAHIWHFFRTTRAFHYQVSPRPHRPAA